MHIIIGNFNDFDLLRRRIKNNKNNKKVTLGILIMKIISFMKMKTDVLCIVKEHQRWR